MRIAITGKGGTGKTTLAAVLARALASAARPCLAIDADTTPNLASCLGVSADLPPLPADISRLETDAAGNRHRVLTASAAEIVQRHAVAAPGNVRLLVVGRVEHAGAG